MFRFDFIGKIILIGYKKQQSIKEINTFQSGSQCP